VGRGARPVPIGSRRSGFCGFDAAGFGRSTGAGAGGDGRAGGRDESLPDRAWMNARREGRLVTVITGAGVRLPLAICGLCSALVAVDEDGELWHARIHAAVDAALSSGAAR
jgi:hypothetical protein